MTENETQTDLGPPAAADPSGSLAEGGTAAPGAATAEPTASPAHDAHLPADLRVPWNFVDVLMFFVFGVGVALLMAQVVAVVLFLVFAVRPEWLRDPNTAKTAQAVLHQVLLSAGMLAYLGVMMRHRFRVPFWKTLRFSAFCVGELTASASGWLLVLAGMLLAIAVQVASFFVRAPSNLPIEGMFLTRPSILMMMTAGILVAPLAEEVFFRGFMYPVFARGLGVTAGVTLTGVLFGLLHAGQLWGGWGQIGLLVLVGMLLTWARARTGSVMASYLLHLGYNALLLLGFFFATGGLRYLPAPR
jgi:membrane protease YdiL (CAAX protease family)